MDGEALGQRPETDAHNRYIVLASKTVGLIDKRLGAFIGIIRSGDNLCDGLVRHHL